MRAHSINLRMFCVSFIHAEIVSLPYKIIENSRRNSSESSHHNCTASPPQFKHVSATPVIVNLYPQPPITSSTPVSLSQHSHPKQQLFSTHSTAPPYTNTTYRKTNPTAKNSSIHEISQSAGIQPDPTSGQNVPISTVPSHYIVNPLLTANGTTPSPPAVASRPAALLQHTMMMINGSKYLLCVPSMGGPPSLVPVSSPPAVPGNAAAYTNAPVQLINTTTPPVSVKPAFQLPPVKSEMLSPKLSRPAPPPLLSIGSPTNYVKANYNEHTHDEKPLIYLQSPPTTCQKLYILPVVSNSPVKNGSVLMPTDRASTYSRSSKSMEECQMTSAMPIYRFGDTVKFLNSPSPHLFPLTRST